MNLEMTIKKLGSAYKFKVGRATGNEHIFLFGLSMLRVPIYIPIEFDIWKVQNLKSISQ